MTSLFEEEVLPEITPRAKTPRLGRYDGIKRRLESTPDPNRVWVDVRTAVPKRSDLNFVDLFCGAGGLTLGLSQAGFNPLGSVELVPIASETHRRNFPNCLHHEGDIAHLGEAWFDGVTVKGEVHLVAGGPPCQGFSLAGYRDPDDPRNRLFLQFLRVVTILQPSYVVMENVPGLLTMKSGEVWREIVECFHSAGYGNVSTAILEAAQYGVPQIRARVIVMANRLGRENPFPKPYLAPTDYRPIEEAIDDLPAWETVPSLNHEWTRHSPAFIERISKVQPGHSLYGTFADAYKRQYLGVPSMTIKENHGGTHLHPRHDRVISAREMARLQTFPDSFVFSGPMKKAMWQIGNAVPPRLGEVIGLALQSSWPGSSP